MYVLGIDGGGTKTKGVICDRQGKVLSQQTVGATNPNSIELHIVENELLTLFNLLQQENHQAFSRIKAIFVGMAGVDRPEDQVKMEQIIHRIYSTMLSQIGEQDAQAEQEIHITIDNDAINALYSGTLGQPGVVNIAGTGSIAFGLNKEGRRERVGGWGYLLGDPGSGYALGRSALQHVFQVHDGFCQKSFLYERVLEVTKVDSPLQLLPIIYEAGKARHAIAPLSQVVVEAADHGDVAAQQIVFSAAEDMARGIECLLAKLFPMANATSNQKKIPVILTGGVYQRADWFVPTIEQKLAQRFSVEIIVPLVQPVAGALVAAWQCLGHELDSQFTAELKQQGLANYA